MTYYYYVIAAANTAGTSPNSDQVAATPASADLIPAWRLANFGSAANSGEGLNTADPENDGVVNLLEYATGNNPKSAGSVPTTVGRSGQLLTLTVNHIADATLVYASRPVAISARPTQASPWWKPIPPSAPPAPRPTRTPCLSMPAPAPSCVSKSPRRKGSVRRE